MKAPFVFPFRIVLRAVTSRFWAAAALAMAGSIVSAQPSGGPYGPVQQRYELPHAKRLFFVAPDGKPEADGLAVDRATTLDRAIREVVTGDAIVLRGGTYRTGGLRLNQGVTLQPYADERPILKGTEVAGDWTPVREGVWRTSWTKLFPAAPADWWRRERHERQTPLHLFNNDMVFADGASLPSVGREQDVTERTYFIDYENGFVYLGLSPDGRVIEITAHDSALVRTFRDVHGKQNDGRGPIVRGITFTQYAYRALEVEGIEPQKHMHPASFGKEVVGTVLEHLTISHCSRVAGYFRGDNLVIRNCLVSDCGTEGIYVINSADVLLEKNIITRTNSAEKLSGYYASAVKIFNQSYRTVCRDNVVIDNPQASGIWYDVGNVDGVFVNNWLERTNDGFFFEISKGAICAGNVFVDCNKGIRVLNSANVHAYQNTLFNSVASFERTERSAAGDHFGWHASAGPDVEERHGHRFANNLLVGDETLKGPLLQFTQTAAVRERLKDPQVELLDGNAYVRRAAAKPQPLVAWSPFTNERNALDIYSLAEWRAHALPFDEHSRAWTNFDGLVFRSAELKNFELLSAFPGATVGVSLPAAVRAGMGARAAPRAFPGAYAPVE